MKYYLVNYFTVSCYISQKIFFALLVMVNHRDLIDMVNTFGGGVILRKNIFELYNP
jgi:hypothetical protein